MNGRWFKKLKKKHKLTKQDVADILHDERTHKHVDRALKFARKAYREIQHDDESGGGCGLWYDVNDGLGYREMCMAGGRCTENQDKCPFYLVKKLISSLERRYSER